MLKRHDIPCRRGRCRSRPGQQRARALLLHVKVQTPSKIFYDDFLGDGLRVPLFLKSVEALQQC